MSFNEKLSYTEHSVVSPTSDFTIGFEDYALTTKDRINVTVDDIDAKEAGYTVTRKSNLVVTLTPPVPNGVVRLQRETNIDTPFHRFTAGAKFVATNVDQNFTQILHSQQEVRNLFGFTQDYIQRTLDNFDLRIQGVEDIVVDLRSDYNDLDKRLNVEVTERKRGDTALKDYIDATINGITGENFLPITDEFVLLSNGRTQTAKNSDILSILDFPTPTGVDWTDTIQAADTYCYTHNKTLYFPNGVYKCTDGIIKRAKWVGEEICHIGVFPLYDDKVNMVGDKSKLKGTVILFTGSGTKVYTTQRTDKFSSMRYAILNIGRETGSTSGMMGRGCENLSIVCDFDFKDESGVITTPLNDNRADYDVGLLLVNSEQSKLDTVCVGGYWKKAGTVHFGQDPDDTHFHEVKTMGNIGLAIIGDGTGTNSGFNGFGCIINANDHHSRYTGDGEDWGECALFIDIPSTAASGSRNGIHFIGGTISTKTDTVVKYDRCGEIAYHGTKFENAPQAGSSQAGGTKQQVGTSNTGNITFIEARFSGREQLNALISSVGNGAVKIIGGTARDGYEYWKGGLGLTIQGSSNATAIQFTDDPASTVGGIVIRRTTDNVLHFTSNNTDFARFNSKGLQFVANDVSTLTVTNNAITVNRNWHRITGGTVVLHTINGGVLGQRLLLNSGLAADRITLQTGTGNLRLNGDFLTTSGQLYIELIYDGANWCELSRSLRPTTTTTTEVV